MASPLIKEPIGIHPIQTFVFLDFEGSGLGSTRPRITELSFVALHRSCLLERELHYVRVMDELTLCINPTRQIPSRVTEITGLDNYNLSHKKDFDADTAMMINCFLRRQMKPICLVAYNGKGYDFGLLKAELACIGCNLTDNIWCVDPLDFFRSQDGFPPMYIWSPFKVKPGVHEKSYSMPMTPERNGKNGKRLLNGAIGRRQLFPDSPPSSHRKLSAKTVDNFGPGSPRKPDDVNQDVDLDQSLHDNEGSLIDEHSLEIYLHDTEEPWDCDDEVGDEELCAAYDAADIQGYGVEFNKEAKERPKLPYRLRDVFHRAFGHYPSKEHCSKDDCYTLAKIYNRFANDILPWSDCEAVKYEVVKPLYKPFKRQVLGEAIFKDFQEF